MRVYFIISALLTGFCCHAQSKDISIVFTSDVHFGIKRAHFRDLKDSVSSYIVNKAMAESIRSLGKTDFLIVTGDIANRQETSIAPASVSWKQFLDVYKPLHIPMLLLPGNHDVSNAIGYYKPMIPATDAGSLEGIFATMHRGRSFDTTDWKYASTQFNYSKNIGGIHFLFVTIWPDSANRIWMEKDLKKIDPKMPVFIFAHDPPEGDPKHFNDTAGRQFDPKDKFEGLLSEVYNRHYEKDWDVFLKMHPSIKAYFHGHSNFQEFYTYKGIDSSLSLPCFRVDSPMKGRYSSKDQRLLSFQVITISPSKKQVEIKECLWNKGKEVEWGQSRVIQL